MASAPDYAAFYCEENVLRLCPSLGPGSFAVLVTNAGRRVEMLRQRAGGAGQGAVSWDYHAFALTRGDGWVVWDFDTTLGWPVPASDYLRLSFEPRALEAPRFRVMTGEEYAREFRSDRSHMRRPDGTWSARPPSWPAAADSGGVRLAQMLDPASICLGEVLTLGQMQERW